MARLRRLPLLVLVLALALAAGAQPASARPFIGVGEQDPRIFAEPHWTALGLRHVRLIVGWDALRVPWERDQVDAYLDAARKAGARVVVGFGRSRVDGRQEVLPSPARMRREFAAWRARYPFLTEYIAWNEANHCSQPTCRRPEAAARIYDQLRAECPHCTILAASVLDTSTMTDWVHRFQRVARDPDAKLIWGLHNYLDANRFRTSGTQALLRATSGRIWFTETGGVVWRRDGRNRIRFNQSRTHAARATRWLFDRLVPLSRRIDRVYLYHFLPSRLPGNWDSALIDDRGRPRPAYAVVRDYLRRTR